MSNYTQTTDFSAKDSLASGDANKIITGASVDVEFAAIATAIATKADDNAVVHLAGVETITGAKTFGALVTFKKGADIASAATIDLSTATGNLVLVTGTTATSAVTMASGQIMRCVAAAAWPLTYHATTNKINTGGSNHTLAAGDQVLYHYDGTTVRGYISKADGTAVRTSFASSAEVKTGTEAAKSIAPDALLAAQGFTARYNSGNQTLTSAGLLTLAHGLGREPILVCFWLKCLTAEANYSIGDKVSVSAIGGDSSADNRRFTAISDSTNISIRFGSNATLFPMLDKTTGAGAGLTNANWALVVEAFA